MPTSNDFLQITLPSVGKPKWKRTFHSEDIKPISSNSSNSSNKQSTHPSPLKSLFRPVKKQQNKPLIQVIDEPIEFIKSTTEYSTTATTSCCPICNNHEVRYTCPKCSTPFCSVECYRIHDIPPPTSSSSSQKEESDKSSSDICKPCSSLFGGGTCTERFYQNKVNQICHLDIRDEQNKSQMNDILKRSFYNSENNDTLIEEEKAHGGMNMLSEDELVELATYVLSMKDLKDHDNDDNENDENITEEDNQSNHDDILDHIPQHLRLKFEQAVQRGELSHLINEWYPYWLPDHQGIGDHNSLVQVHSDDLQGITLDERILSVPKLIKPSSKHVELQYNICEVLYHTAYVLRLYNGCSCDDSNNQVNIDSATTLYLYCDALFNDKKYSSLNEAFMECTINGSRLSNEIHFNQKKSINGDSLNWKVLLNDVRHISQNKRLVLRVLFHAMDILSRGIQNLKSIKSDQKLLDEHTQLKKKWRLAKKKLEYYASWTIMNWKLVETDTAYDIKEWMDDWILKESDKSKMKDVQIVASLSDQNVQHSRNNEKRKRMIEPELMMNPISTRLT